MTEDGRPRGEWRRTPLWLRLLGRPPFMRPVYAHGAIGGGWDEWEFSESPKTIREA